MILKNPPAFTKPALVFLVILGFYAAPRSSDSILVRIGRQQKAHIPDQWLQDVRVLQELDTCSIAEASSDSLSRMSEAGLSFEVLDSSPVGKPYYLVYASFPEDYATLERVGSVRQVEDGIFLFWCDTEDIRELLPAHLELKRLPSDTHLFLEVETGLAPRPFPEWTESARSTSADPRILQMVSQVSKENLTSYIESLQGFETRYASTSNCEDSGAYLYDYFDRLGLQSEYDPFNFGSKYSSRNVVAAIPGSVAPDQVIIVCAHYDSTSNQATVRAPGADDDASGTAAVMEIARIMSGYSFDFTVKFICFSAEEWGLWGSRHYAQAARQNEDQILAVINMDMIGYTNALPEDLDLIANPRSQWLVDRFISSSTAYTTLDFRKAINASITGSDHSPFWDQGYSALLGIEDTPLANPYYHKTTDTIDTLNMDFVASVTGASVAAAADLAQPESTPSAPSGVTARSQINRSLFSRFKTTYLSWDPSRQPVVGYRVYRSNTSRGDYQLINAVTPSKTTFADRFLKPDANYFYVITAVDSQGRESNYSEEVRDDQDNQS